MYRVSHPIRNSNLTLIMRRSTYKTIFTLKDYNIHKEKFKWGIKINDLNALFQELNYRRLIYRHQFIYLRYVWKICIKGTKKKKKIITLTRSMIFFALRRPGDVTLKLKLAM